MKKNELVSIVVPVYNCEKYLKKTIESIINQTYENTEIIIIDDGSKDKSGTICDEYAKKYKNIKVIHKKNAGVACARNEGIEHSKGKYICFFDSDDYIEKNFIEFCVNSIEKYNLQLINTGFFSEVEKNGVITKSDIINAKEKLYLTKEALKNDLVYLWDTHMLYNIWNKMYLNSIIKKNNIKFPNKNFGEDMDFNIEYLYFVNKFLNSSECFYHYIKERKDSITNKYNKALFEIRVNEYYKFNEYFAKNQLSEQEYLEFSSRRFIERVVGCIENICGASISSKEKLKDIKKILQHELTKQTLKKAKLKSKKMKLLMIPIKIKSIYLTYAMGKVISMIRNRMPDLFNHLKNQR